MNEKSGKDLGIAVGKDRAKLDRTGGRIDSIVDRINPASNLEAGFLENKRRRNFGVSIRVLVTAPLLEDLRHEPLRDLEVREERIDPANRGQQSGLAGANQIAGQDDGG